MNFNTPLVEYLIIGFHTTSWLIITIYGFLDLPLTSITKINPALALLILPIIYLIGMIFDDLAYHPLKPISKKIKENIYDSNACKDELIAYESQVLYVAYESRVRRVRIVGAAIFNWPLLGMSIFLHIGFENLWHTNTTIIISFILSFISYLTWKNLYRRAYKFRKNACEIILQDKKDLSIKIVT